MKKALTELLILHLLAQREYFIGELTATLNEQSGGVLNIVFPYSAVYRLQQSQYIAECDKRIAPDGRRRQFFTITPTGREYYQQLFAIYNDLSRGINAILNHTD